MKLKGLNSLYSLLKDSELHGRYITNLDIEKSLKKFPKSIISTVGYSVENRPIYGLKFGEGQKKILLWSQMHGNETTTTKALFDCFRLFMTNNDFTNPILELSTLLVIPILNPDGAERYTRLNANEIDLNRDAQDLTQPESKILKAVFESFRPDYCFNLHGQRTIYNVGDAKVPAALSFLSPAQDIGRSLTGNRKLAMSIIAKINLILQKEIPNAIARYDDSFNINCVGDTFQNKGIPTILYEAGHYYNDYDREEVRRLIFLALIVGLDSIVNPMELPNYNTYFDIPENGKLFFDILIKNASLNLENSQTSSVGILFEERLVNQKVKFIPVVKSISKLDKYFGHQEIDAKGQFVLSSEFSELKVANEIDFVVINNEKIALKP